MKFSTDAVRGICLITFGILFGCASTVNVQDEQQKALATTLQAIQLVDQAALAADVAVKTGKLKGDAAIKTLNGLKMARAGLQIATTAQQVTP